MATHCLGSPGHAHKDPEALAGIPTSAQDWAQRPQGSCSGPAGLLRATVLQSLEWRDRISRTIGTQEATQTASGSEEGIAGPRAGVQWGHWKVAGADQCEEDSSPSTQGSEQRQDWEGRPALLPPPEARPRPPYPKSCCTS